MTIEKLITKSNVERELFIEENFLLSSAYDTFVNQLTILARENNGILPNEFIISDNKDLFLTFENILKICKHLDLRVDSISNNVPIHIRMTGNIPETVYTDDYYKLYHLILVSKSK